MFGLGTARAGRYSKKYVMIFFRGTVTYASWLARRAEGRECRGTEIRIFDDPR